MISIKAAKKVGLIFASNFNRRKVNLREALEPGVFAIITVWGGALDAYPYLVA